MSNEDRLIPPPLPPLNPPYLAVGRYGATHVDAEDFSRRLGNWGGASQMIGARWEALVPVKLRPRLPWLLPLGGGRVMVAEALLALDADPVAGRALQRAGVSAPDLLLVGRMGTPGSGGRVIVRAVDCKVSLDTAEIQQTAPARLQATLQRIRGSYPAVVAALRAQLADVPPPARELVSAALEAALASRWDSVVAGEGLFVAPESGFNRWFLAQLENRRRTGAPLGRLPFSGPRRDPADVRGPVDAARAARLALPAHLEPVSAVEFLGDLAGWPEAALIAEIDGIALDEVDLAIAERCWRAGAGLRGATIAIRRRLFAAPIEATDVHGRPRDVVALLRRAISRRRLPDSGALVAMVAQAVASRRPLWEREASVLRPPITFGAFVSRLREPGDAGEDDDEAAGLAEPAPGRALDEPLRGARPPGARALYAEMASRHRRRVLAAADALHDSGMDEIATLEALEARIAEWAAAALADAGELAATS